MIVIQIAGTNGKGSIAHYLSGIARAAGFTTGLYISPHLCFREERIRIDGHTIPASALTGLLEKHSGGGLFANYTAACVEWFRQNNVSIAVMETGLGGRLDPVTALAAHISILATIGMDHMQLLGDTIEKIAIEKCAIIPHKGCVISLPQLPAVSSIIEATCHGRKAGLTYVEGYTAENGSFRFKNYDRLEIAALGSMQPLNACAAILAAERLSCFGRHIDATAIRDGLKNTRIPARAQYFPGHDLLVDGAHNPDAFRELGNTVAKHFSRRKVVLLTASMKEKDITSLVQLSVQNNWTVVATELAESRFASAAELGSLFPASITIKNPEAAYKKAITLAQETGAMVVVAGSFYLAGQVLKYIQKSNISNVFL